MDFWNYCQGENALQIRCIDCHKEKANGSTKCAECYYPDMIRTLDKDIT